MCKQLFGEKKVSYKASGSKTGMFFSPSSQTHVANNNGQNQIRLRSLDIISLLSNIELFI